MMFTLALPVAAQTVTSVEVKPIPEVTAVPYPICKYVTVTPGNPLHLQGRGSLNAKGRGEIHLNVKRGMASLEGRGIVAVKASNNDTVNGSGMGKKIEIGEWVLYIGRGKLSVYGDDFEVVAHGRFKVRARGAGSADFKGWWEVRYCRLLVAEPMPIPQIIPDHLKSEIIK